MTKHLHATFLAFLLLLTSTVAANAFSGLQLSRPPQLLYGVQFEQRFDNREYDNSSFNPSGTIFGARLSPYIGVGISSNRATHRIVVGADLYKDFGNDTALKDNILQQILFYYDCSLRLGRDATFGMSAGVLPRHLMKETFGIAFFSEERLWYDNNIEGLLFSIEKQRKYRIELALDWMGQFGSTPTTREQFMILSAGSGRLSRFFKIGYNAYYQHLANSSENLEGVVDNFLAKPWITAVLDPRRKLFDDFSVKAGVLFSAQRDRRLSGDFDTPLCGEISLHLEKWNVSIDNSLFLGNDMMPYYCKEDANGEQYGDSLYAGDAFFRMKRAETPDFTKKETGLYDRLALSFCPKISRGLNLKISSVFHFNGGVGFSGCQQIIGIVFDLDEFLK